MRKAELDRWGRYFTYRNVEGLSVPAAAKKARMDRSTAYRFERNDPTSGGLEAAAILGVNQINGNLIAQPLNPAAQAALTDFGLFRRRYMGRESTPWQERAAYEVLRLRSTPDKEYAVINCPPGSGKSTLFTHDIPVWMIVLDRTIRIQVSSRTERQARAYVSRIRRTLERDIPLKASSEDLELGRAFDAEATLAADYGAFKPETRSEKWRDDELVVRQTDGVAIDDKESTLSAYGADSGFLGQRFDLIIWDDLVDRKNTRHASSREELRVWYESDAETRLEPGGLLVLQGQRIHSQDLYKSALELTHLDGTKKYHHIRFPAHDDERCEGRHSPDAPAWPQGCLLDPHRIPWRELEQKKHSQPRQYQIMYQQRDDITGEGLVHPAWINGGADNEQVTHPGCLDHDRTAGTHPAPGDPGGWNFVTVDPSPTNYWGVIWWWYDPDTQTKHIVDLWRKRMSPQDFLGYDIDTGEFSGLAEQIHRDSQEMGSHITGIVFEANAAQRWFLTQPHIPRWQTTRGITIHPHSTNTNKLDPKFGLESIGDEFRQGKIRIPYSGPTTRIKAGALIDEAILYPQTDTDDMLMSVWFSRVAVNTLYTPNRSGMYQATGVPWRSGASRGMVRT